MSREFWNEKFGGDEYRYGTEPNAFLKARAVAVFPEGGRVVCLGDGEGRNSVWLATQGYEVVAVDPSEVGLEKTRRLAEDRGVAVETVHGTAQEFARGYDGAGFDGVVLIYLHAPLAVRPEIHKVAQGLLAPGGVVLLEGFTPAQRELGRTSGGPGDVAMLFTAEMLREDFDGLSIEELDEVETRLDEGPGHRGVANVVRMIGRR